MVSDAWKVLEDTWLRPARRQAEINHDVPEIPTLTEVVAPPPPARDTWLTDTVHKIKLFSAMRAGQTFTPDEFRAFHVEQGGQEPASPKAWGPVWMEVYARGIAIRTNRWVYSGRRVAKRRLVRVLIGRKIG